MENPALSCSKGNHCFIYDCKAKHPPRRKIPCRYGEKCTNKECTWAHPPERIVGSSAKNTTTCRYQLQCTNPLCSFVHPESWNPHKSTRDQDNKTCRYGFTCHSPACKFIHPPAPADGNRKPSAQQCALEEDCIDFSCNLMHLPERPRPCRSAASCWNYDCSFLHPDDRQELCDRQIQCTDFTCDKLHPKGRPYRCKSGKTCSNSSCVFLHPNDRASTCPLGKQCKDLMCSHPHPVSRPRKCLSIDTCYDPDCFRLHSPLRKLCHKGAMCDKFACDLIHPPDRVKSCKHAEKCANYGCSFLHPTSRSALCREGVSCANVNCALIHPSQRPPVCPLGADCDNPDCEGLHAPIPTLASPHTDNNNNKKSKNRIRSRRPNIALKSQEQRKKERRQAGLPILQCQEEFIQRLRQEKVLVVTAQTGSGKTTQLPQYAAEAFEGLVVCTQPRALAALSISQRISQEFDGCPVGQSVGYKAGGGKAVHGSRIMLMTDSSLVMKAQHQPDLKDVSVLIIDEAHERSLNTDLVLGIAMLVRRMRPDNFYVVICSATIDPKPFLEFFFGEPSITGKTNPRSLDVPGRVFPVSMEEVAIESKDKTEDMTQILLQSLEKHKEGHCLVFLPGSAEVDKAVKTFRKVAPSEWIPLPLYGSLPPEEQNRVLTFDDQDSSLRMVVFCTNIAETSLTVPKVRIVVDTGLAKEARYDPARRMTVLEQVYISRSSADQRKGRAGRTSPGVCVRLFADNVLTRPNIEPEVLRSSLDLVVLQLRRLGYDPLDFPFMDRPRQQFLESSIQLLTELGCLDSETKKITNKGILYSQLPFDPRMSHFVVSAHEQFNSLELAAEVAAILTAPGSIFFMGGSQKEAKDEAKRRIAEIARNYESDLLFLHSMFQKWNQAGEVDEGKCKTCQKPQRSSCRPCRVAHSNQFGLNNRVLEVARGTVDQVKKVLAMAKLSSTPSPASVPPEEVLGRCLVASFQEQMAEFLMPKNPDAGVYLIANNLKGILQQGSALAQRVGQHKKNRATPSAETYTHAHFIAMSVMQIPSGQLIVDKSHPVILSWLPDRLRSKLEDISLDIVECFSRGNLHPRFCTLLHKFFQQTSIDSTTGNNSNNKIHQFVVCQYDGPSSTVRVFGPRKASQEIRLQCSFLVDQQLRSDLEFEATSVVAKGSGVVTVIAGLITEKLEGVGLAARVHFPNPPIDPATTEGLAKWIKSIAKVKKEDIKWLRYVDSGPSLNDPMAKDPYGVAVFRNSEIAEEVRKAAEQSSTHPLQQPKEATAASVHLSLSQEWGCRCTLRFASDLPLDEAVVQKRINEQGFQPLKVTRTFVAPEYTLQISNLSPGLTSAVLTTLFTPAPTKVSVLPPKYGACRAYLSFPTKVHLDQATQFFRQHPLGTQMLTVQVPRKNGGTVAREVYPQIAQQEKPGLCQFSIIFPASTEAQKYYESLRGEGVDGEAVAEVEHPQLFDLDMLTRNISAKFQVQADIKTKPQQSKSTARITFRAGSPVSCGQAAQSLASSTAPMKVRLGDRKQQLMIGELCDSELLDKWAEQLGVKVKLLENRKNRPGTPRVWGLSINGPQIAQGQLMSKIGDYSDSFSQRYVVAELEAEASCLFQNKRIGESKLIALEKDLNNGTSAQFWRQLGGVEIYVPAGIAQASTIIAKCQQVISQVLKDYGHAEAKPSACVFCRKSGIRSLHICGHKFCTDCIVAAVQQSAATGTFPISCPRCQTRVAIQDIRDSLPASIYEEACHSSALAYLRANHSHPLGLCPVPECGALVPRAQGYSICTSCGNGICLQCRTKNDDLHKGLDCAQYRRQLCKHRSLDQLIEQAKKFVETNWSAKLGDASRIDPNPGLVRGCPAIQRYCRGALQAGGMDAIKNGFFAWHGTSESAVAAICHDGFDPGRRSGQAYGVGEYFGQTAEVSQGYCQGSRMLVAHLLRVSQTSTHGNFCYVVNNPKDWHLAYNLPVLVVTFGNPLATYPSFILSDPSPVPLFLQDGEQDGVDYSLDAISGFRGDRLIKGPRHYNTPFRWHWQKDDGNFEPYPDNLNHKIEESYVLYQTGKGSHVFNTGFIVRYVDDQPSEYLLDFSCNTQTRVATGYVRGLHRKRVDEVAAQGARWEYQTLNGKWRRFESLVQGLLDRNYRAYIDGHGPALCTLQFPGRPEIYALDFVVGEQTNTTSETKRAIRRVVVNDPSDLNEAEEIVVDVPPGELAKLNVETLGSELRKMVERAGVKDDMDLPSLVDLGKGQIILTISGVAKTICPLLVGRIQNELFQMCHIVGKPQAFGTTGRRMQQNPRLLVLATAKQSNLRWTNRDEVMLLLAHATVWEANCSLYGGFVRDWVINGDPANDIDVGLPLLGSVQSVRDTLQHYAATIGIQLTEEKQKGMAHTLVFSGSFGKNVEVDLVDLSNPRTNPGVDCDVGNFLINKALSLTRKVEGKLLSLAVSQKHCQRKKFVFYYNPQTSGDASMCEARLIKYLSRGWICLSPLPQALIAKLSAYHSQLKPKQKYNQPWWTMG
eukprot:TRINITY_DN512_c0_g2_i1.p1 TRINITY_DN512_c0_g2~~TRINITY_DN512_c0_g2_i1.p1  ORF type:complete len:2506 (-),score=-35.58 TRINITY_DN512_c0_g2_i1:398-7915(-)